MRRSTLHTDRHSKKGITLVELIVAMTLTAMFAVVCVSLINPISRIYQRTTKITKAQLLADTIVDAIRKECDDADNGTITAAWIAKLGDSEPDDRKLINPGPEGVKEPSGNVLVFQRNNNYCEAIYACVEVSDTNKANVESTSNPDSIKLAGHSVVRLFDTSGNDNRKEGLVHFGYYQSIDTSDGIKPERAYDYTNPVLASTYGNYTVELEFTKLVFKKVNGNNVCPAYVNCTVNVKEGSKTVYSRDAVISFSANGSGKGAGGGGGQTTPSKIKDIEVIVKWDDKGIKDRRPAEGVLITLTNGSGTVIKTHPFSNADIIKGNQQKFVFKGIDISNGYKVYQTEDPAATGYAPVSIKQTAKGFVLTNKYSSVTLLSGPAFNDVLKSVSGKNIKVIEKVIFGGPEIGNGVSLNSASKISNVAVDSQGNITDEYKLYYFAGSKTAYVISYSSDGKFIAHSNCSSMFADCEGLTNITWNDDSASHDFIINTANTTNMASMFKNCKAMTQFNLKNLVQSNCASTASMFENCQHGSQLNGISTWNTDSVTDMSKMFFNYGIYHTDDSDGSIDVSSFNFKSCTTMKQMFANDVNDELEVAEIKFPLSTASSLKNMNNVTNMEQLFFGNAKLAKITNFNCMDCQKLTNVNKMFDGCKALTELNLQYFIMPNCDIEDQYQQGKQYHAFWECDNLTEINLDGWDISSETNLRDFFGYMPKLKRVSLIDCKTPKLQSAEGLFYHCFGLEEVYMPGFVGEKCTTIRSIFNECKALEQWNISGWNTKNVKYMRDAFYMVNANSATALKLDLSSWDFSSAIDITEFCYKSGFSEIKFKPHNADSPLDFNKVTSIKYMFSECSRLTKLENFNNATFNSPIKFENKYDEHGNQKKDYGSDNLFSKCPKLTTIDISGLKLPKCESARDMFSGCSELTHVIMNDVNLYASNNYNNVFNGCNKLNKIEMNRVDFSNATTLAFISAPANLKELYMANALLPKISSLSAWFSKKNIEYVDLSDVELNACTNTSSMFYYCYKLKTVRMNNFKTPVNTTCESMFENCYSIKVFEAANWDTGNVNSMKKMFFKSCYYDGNYCKSYDKVTIDLSSFDFTNVTTCESMFHCDNPGNNVNRDCISTVRFPSSASGGDPYAAKCTSFYNMFKFRKGMSNIENLGEFRVNVEVLTDISYIFSNTGVITLDVSGLNLTGSTASAKNMFESCDNLTKIYVAPGTDWSSENFSTYATMFNKSINIVGGNNTTYNATIVDKRYARIDKDGYPGYFTDINDKPAPEANP